MKKAISAVIIFACLLSLTVPFVSAAGALSKTEAIKIFEIGYGRSDLVIYGELDDLPWLTEEEKDKYFIYDRMRWNDEKNPIVFEESTSGEKYDEPVKYRELTAVKLFEWSDWDGEENTVTVDFLNSFILEYYTEEMRDRLFTSEYHYRDALTNKWVYKECELFRTDEETGVALVGGELRYDRQFDRFWLGRWLNVYDFTSNASTAVLTVVAERINYVEGYSPTLETVIFKNTKNGWRISGGTLFEVAYFEGSPSYGYEVNEFEKLAANAYNEYYLLKRNYWGYFLREIETEDGKKYWDFNSLAYMEEAMFKIKDAYTTITFTHSLKGEEYDEPQVYYRGAIGEGLLSISTLKEYRDYLSSIMLPSLYEHLFFTRDGKYEYFRTETIGGEGILINESFFTRSESYRSEKLYEYYRYVGHHMLSKDKVRIYVVLSRYDNQKYESDYYETYIDAKKIDGKWIACGGEMFDVLNGEKEPQFFEPVRTGDDSMQNALFFMLLASFSLGGAWSVCRRKMRG